MTKVFVEQPLASPGSANKVMQLYYASLRSKYKPNLKHIMLALSSLPKKVHLHSAMRTLTLDSDRKSVHTGTYTFIMALKLENVTTYILRQWHDMLAISSLPFQKVHLHSGMQTFTLYSVRESVHTGKYTFIMALKLENVTTYI